MNSALQRDSAFRPGVLDLIIGSMFGSKTEELIRRFKSAKYLYGVKRRIIKPAIDNRYSNTDVASHNHSTFPATLVNHEDLSELKMILGTYNDDMLGFEEVNFFNNGISKIIRERLEKGVHVIASGLDYDFKRDPFGEIRELINLCLESGGDIQRMYGNCAFPGCRNRGLWTQRLYLGGPVLSTDKIIVVGNDDLNLENESYECRCDLHHYVPDKPSTFQRTLSIEEEIEVELAKIFIREVDLTRNPDKKVNQILTLREEMLRDVIPNYGRHLK